MDVQRIEHGTVFWFSRKPNEMCGWMICQGEKIFFKYARREFCSPGEPGRAQFGKSWTVGLEIPERFGTATPGRIPTGRITLVFNRQRSEEFGYEAVCWAFQDEFTWACGTSRLTPTLPQAQQLLSTLTRNILTYTHTPHPITDPDFKVTLIRIEWRQGHSGPLLALGQFEEDPEQSQSSVTILDSKIHRKTTFANEAAKSLKLLGELGDATQGVEVTVIAKNAAETFLVNPAQIRNMTRDETAATADHWYPCLGDDDSWLRCTFTPGIGRENQVVRIIWDA